MNRILNIFKDPRDYQILFLGGFLFFGILFLEWEYNLEHYLTTIGAALLVQTLFIKIHDLKWNSLKSAIITSLGLCILLKSNETYVYAMAGSVSMLAKFLIQKDKKHIFNPVNLGIVLSIILTDDAWISNGQWGSGAILLFLFGTAGLTVLVKVKRLTTGFAFLLTLFVLEFGYKILYLGWPFDHLTHQFFNGTILLFSFFMITDPRTTPNHNKAQIIWSVAIALVSFYIMEWHYVQSAPIWVLFFASPATILLNKIFKAKPFKWQYQSTITSISKSN